MGRYLDRAVLTPLGLHLLAWCFVDELDSSGLALFGALVAVFVTALLAGAAMTPGRAVLAALWFPALATGTDFYWLIDSRAPYGPAKAFLGDAAWDTTGGRVPFLLLCAAVTAVGLVSPILSPPARKALNRFSWSDQLED